MPGTIAAPNILQDPGYIFRAPLLSAEPANTVVGGKFTDTWPVAWTEMGATMDGSEFSYTMKLSAISVAEFLDPIRWATVERMGSLTFAMTNWALTNWAWATNGVSPTIVSGTGLTQLNSLVPQTPGQEVRAMLGWESLDNTARIIMYQTINGTDIKSAFKKAPSIGSIPCVFNFEIPASTIPWKMYTAGTNRA